MDLIDDMFPCIQTYTRAEVNLLKSLLRTGPYMVRDVVPVYNPGCFSPVDLVSGPIQSSQEAVLLTEDVILFPEELEILILGRKYPRGRYKLETNEIKKLEKVAEFLFLIPTDEVPLYINEFPILVNWRTMIGK